MCLHQIIEAWSTARFVTIFPKGIVNQGYFDNERGPLLTALRKSVHFVLEDYAGIMRSGEITDPSPLINLPFPIFSVEAAGNADPIYPAYLTAICEKASEKDADKCPGYIPLIWVKAHALSSGSSGTRLWTDYYYYWVLYFCDAGKTEVKAKAFSPIGDDTDFCGGNSALCLDVTQFAGAMVYDFLSVLSCSNVITKTVPAPEKLNIKRRRKGLEVVREYKTLHLDIPTTRAKYGMANDASGRTSPRLHFRRGHIRSLPSGVKTWVTHCMVGDGKRGMIDKEYQL